VNLETDRGLLSDLNSDYFYNMERSSLVAKLIICFYFWSAIALCDFLLLKNPKNWKISPLKCSIINVPKFVME